MQFGLRNTKHLIFCASFRYPKYTEKTAAGFLVNFVALILVAYVSLVVYLVTKPDFKRQPLPEEQVINLNFDLTSNN